MTYAIRSERGLGQSILAVSYADVDSDDTLRDGLPPGFGDCLITEVLVSVTGAADLPTDALLAVSGPLVQVEISSGVVDFVGIGRWVKNAGTTATTTEGVAAHIIPDEPVFWHEGEDLRIDYAEIDVNATPTGDVTIFVRVQRLRVPQQISEGFQLTS